MSDTVILTIKLGTCTYAVTNVNKISETDNSLLATTAENCITLFTCVTDGTIRNVDSYNPTVGIPGAVIRITNVQQDDGGSFNNTYITGDGGYISKENLDFTTLPKGIEKDRSKTKSSYRTLPLVPLFEELLYRLQEQQEMNRKLCGRMYNKEFSGYIYVNEIGELVKPGYITQHFPLVLQKNDMRRIRFHDLWYS